MKVGGTRCFFVSDAASEAINLRSSTAKPAGGRSSSSAVGRNYSQTMNVMVERFADVMARHLPALSDDEWAFLDEALPADVRGPMVDLLPNVVKTQAQTLGLDGHHGVRGDGLVKKLQKLSYVEKVAVVDHLEVRQARSHTPVE